MRDEAEKTDTMSLNLTPRQITSSVTAASRPVSCQQLQREIFTRGKMAQQAATQIYVIKDDRVAGGQRHHRGKRNPF